MKNLLVNPHANAHQFLAAAEHWLLQKEVEHNVLLADAYLLSGDHHFKDPVFLATIEDRGATIGCVLLPPPDGLYLTDMPSAVLPLVCDQLRDRYEHIPAITGPEPVIAEFAELWNPGSWSVQTRLRWYSSRSPLDRKPQVRGQLRHAIAADMETLDTWAPVFAKEFGTRVDVRFLFRTMMDRRLLYVWDDDGPKCVVSVSGLTPTAARISSLYTPSEYRRRGYAFAAVLSATHQVFDDGRSLCCASADTSSMGPNAIFKAAGFADGEEFAVIHPQSE